MTLSRRSFVVSAAAAGTVTLLPFGALADGHGANVFKTAAGDVTVHPITHASLVLETPKGTVYVDPVFPAEAQPDLPKPDLIVVTHHHGDHFRPDMLKTLKTADTPMIVNPEVMGKLPDDLKANTTVMANGDAGEMLGIKFNAIPAYNLDPEKQKFHPKGRDNGYVMDVDGFRIYISGDTEDIPEMRALENIDIAFVCMNLPFTMPASAAANAVAEFKPKYVYPYHYRGRDGGTQDPQEFAKLVGDAAEVKLGDWYS